MSKKDKKRERQEFDTDKIKKKIKDNAIAMEPYEYSDEKMPIYGSNVNLRRQIPEIRDGLIPVQRRILMSLYENKLYKGHFSKSIQLVGSVAKSYHPHGDSSIYNSLICMGQPWRNTITMVACQGNYGTAYNSDGYAHMRYTGTSMSDFAYDCFFSDWKFTSPEKDMIVDWVSNFDDSGLEPMYLPAKYPVFLLTWRRSLGIGRYCGLFGFSINDAFKATIKLIKNPDDKFIIYPEDPEGSDLINSSDFKNVLDSTSLSARMRGTYSVNHYNGHDIIEINSTPFEVDPKTVETAIKTAVEKGKLPEISDINGCSEDLGLSFRLSIEVRKGYDPVSIMSKVYKVSQLENTYAMKYQFVNGVESADYTLRMAILEWIRCRRETLKRIHKSRLIWVIKRRFFLEPLIKVIESGQIDEFVKIVRTNTKKDSIIKIMHKWELTDYQAEKIIDVKISDLSKDKLPEYRNELSDLREEESKLTELVNDYSKLDDLIISDLEEGMKKYGTPRKSAVMHLVGRSMISDSLNYLIFTNKYIKKLPYDERGYKIGKLDNGEKVIKIIVASDKDTIVIFTKDGRCTPILVNDIPITNLQSIGILYTQCKVKVNDFVDVINIEGIDPKGMYLVSVTKNGLISKTSCEELSEKTNSFTLMKISDNDSLVGVSITNDSADQIIVYTKNGNAAIFPFNDFETTSFNTKGIQSIKLKEEDFVSGVLTISKSHTGIVLLTDKGFVKYILSKNIPSTKRNGKTVELNSGYGTIVDIVDIEESDKGLYIFTTDGVLILDPDNINATNRLGKPEKAVQLEQKDYAFQLMYK